MWSSQILGSDSFSDYTPTQRSPFQPKSHELPPKNIGPQKNAKVHPLSAGDISAPPDDNSFFPDEIQVQTAAAYKSLDSGLFKSGFTDAVNDRAIPKAHYKFGSNGLVGPIPPTKDAYGLEHQASAREPAIGVVPRIAALSSDNALNLGWHSDAKLLPNMHLDLGPLKLPRPVPEREYQPKKTQHPMTPQVESISKWLNNKPSTSECRTARLHSAAMAKQENSRQSISFELISKAKLLLKSLSSSFDGSARAFDGSAGAFDGSASAFDGSARAFDGSASAFDGSAIDGPVAGSSLSIDPVVKNVVDYPALPKLNFTKKTRSVIESAAKFTGEKPLGGFKKKLGPSFPTFKKQRTAKPSQDSGGLRTSAAAVEAGLVGSRSTSSTGGSLESKKDYPIKRRPKLPEPTKQAVIIMKDDSGLEQLNRILTELSDKLDEAKQVKDSRYPKMPAKEAVNLKGDADKVRQVVLESGAVREIIELSSKRMTEELKCYMKDLISQDHGVKPVVNDSLTMSEAKRLAVRALQKGGGIYLLHHLFMSMWAYRIKYPRVAEYTNNLKQAFDIWRGWRRYLRTEIPISTSGLCNYVGCSKLVNAYKTAEQRMLFWCFYRLRQTLDTVIFTPLRNEPSLQQIRYLLSANALKQIPLGAKPRLSRHIPLVEPELMELREWDDSRRNSRAVQRLSLARHGGMFEV